jgi:hypothetical protein
MTQAIHTRQKLEQSTLDRKNVNYIDSSRFGSPAKGIPTSGQNVAGFVRGERNNDFIDLVYRARETDSGQLEIDSDFRSAIDVSCPLLMLASLICPVRRR